MRNNYDKHRKLSGQKIGQQKHKELASRRASNKVAAKSSARNRKAGA